MNSSSEVFRYCVAGSIAFICDVAVLFIAAEKLELHYLAANAIGYSLGMITAYLLNTHWVFKEHRYTDKKIEFAFFNAILIAGLVVSEVAIFFFHQVMNLDLLTAKITSAAITFGVNYIVRKRLLFTQSGPPPTISQYPLDTCNASLENTARCLACQGTITEPQSPEYNVTVQAAINDYSDFFLVRCPTCDLVITCGITPQILQAAYASEYYGTGSQKFLGFIETALKYLSKRRAQWLKSYFGRNQDRPLRALDIGCGRGLLLNALQNEGLEVTGLERSVTPLSQTMVKDVHIGELSDPEITKNAYDVIIMWHVLEHLETPHRVLSECRNLLRPNGIIAIAIPNYASLQRRAFGRHWFHLDIPRHVVHISDQWLENQLTNQGFSIEKVSHTDLLQNTYGFIQSALNRFFLRKPNFLYAALTSGQLRTDDLPALFVHGAFAACIFPVAVLEGLISAHRKTGATVQLIARKNFDQP